MVARLSALEHDFSTGTRRINPHALYVVSTIAMGSNAKATLGQIENLAYQQKEDIRALGLKILDVKAKRDRIAHCMPAERDGFAEFHGIAASKRNMGASYPYKATEIEGWASKLSDAVKELSAIVDELTGLTLEQTIQSAQQWREAHFEEARRLSALLNRRDSAPPTSPEE